jgi:hypothetical protein
MSNRIDNIRAGIQPYLLEKDVKLAERYLSERKFEELRDLVLSNVYILNEHLKLDPNDRLVEERLKGCLTLQLNVTSYLDQLGIEVENGDVYDNIDLVVDVNDFL